MSASSGRMLVRDLLALVPSGIKQKVADAHRRYLQPVRDALSKELRFPLTWNSKEGNESWITSCSVEVDEVGYPIELEMLRIPDDFRLAALLQMWLLR